MVFPWNTGDIYSASECINSQRNSAGNSFEMLMLCMAWSGFTTERQKWEFLTDLDTISSQFRIISARKQERTGSNSFDHNNLTLQYKLDNEFELIFVVAFQKILQLAYVDKFLSDVHLEFRDKYKNELVSRANRSFQQYDFLAEFNYILEEAEKWGEKSSEKSK